VSRQSSGLRLEGLLSGRLRLLTRANLSRGAVTNSGCFPAVPRIRPCYSQDHKRTRSARPGQIHRASVLITMTHGEPEWIS
jgi:hypothetical protein